MIHLTKLSSPNSNKHVCFQVFIKSLNLKAMQPPPSRVLKQSSFKDKRRILANSRPARERPIRSESWIDFHERHHSDLFHYSCGNESYLIRNSCGACFMDNIGGADDNNWFMELFGCLVTPKKSSRKMGEDDDSEGSSGSRGRLSKSRRSLFRNDKPQGNIRVDSITF